MPAALATPPTPPALFRTCQNCGKSFSRQRWDTVERFATRQYCGHRCSYIGKGKKQRRPPKVPIARNCAGCGVVFSHISPTAKFCSRQCIWKVKRSSWGEQQAQRRPRVLAEHPPHIQYTDSRRAKFDYGWPRWEHQLFRATDWVRVI